MTAPSDSFENQVQVPRGPVPLPRVNAESRDGWRRSVLILLGLRRSPTRVREANPTSPRGRPSYTATLSTHDAATLVADRTVEHKRPPSVRDDGA